jgi:hypothetical protein
MVSTEGQDEVGEPSTVGAPVGAANPPQAANRAAAKMHRETVRSDLLRMEPPRRAVD